MTGKPQRYAIVGMKHVGKEAVETVRLVPHHHPVTLVREPTNRFDRNAVQVWIDGKRVGYISKDQNAVLSTFIEHFGDAFTPPGGMAMDAQPTKSVRARMHKGNNEYPLVEIA